MAFFCAGFVAAVLLWSGVVKIRRPVPAALAMTRFGLVREVHRRAGSALGLAEAGLGIALLVWPRSPAPRPVALYLSYRRSASEDWPARGPLGRGPTALPASDRDERDES